jgi:hypothetical protein
MKRILLLAVITAVVSCNANKEEAIKSSSIETIEDSATVEPTLQYIPESKLYVWKANFDYTKVQNPALQRAILNTDSLIKGLNERYENVFLQKDRIGGDTLYTFIYDSQYLGNQMGSTGAEVYIADVVLNLAEIPGVKYVAIKMEEGSHAQSGVWTKQNFEQYKTVKE